MIKIESIRDGHPLIVSVTLENGFRASFDVGIDTLEYVENLREAADEYRKWILEEGADYES